MKRFVSVEGLSPQDREGSHTMPAGSIWSDFGRVGRKSTKADPAKKAKRKAAEKARRRNR
jgi:hypothetical protein